MKGPRHQTVAAAVVVWALAVWLVASDRHATSASPDVGRISTFADVGRSGFVVVGSGGTRAFVVESGRVVPSASLSHDDVGSRTQPTWRCGSAACESIIVSAGSGQSIDPETGALLVSPGGTSRHRVASPLGQVEVVHAEGLAHFLAVLYEPRQGAQLVEVRDGAVSPLGTAGGPGVRVTTSPSRRHVAVETGLSDAGVGAAHRHVTHWLSADGDGRWRTVRTGNDSRVLCLSDEGESVVERAGAATVEAAGGKGHALESRPVLGAGVRVPCAFGADGVLVAAPLEGGGVIRLDGSRLPVRRWGIAWMDEAGPPRAVLQPDVRRVALSSDGRFAAVVDKADEVVVYAESGARKRVAASASDIAFLPSGELAVLGGKGDIVVVSPGELP